MSSNEAASTAPSRLNAATIAELIAAATPGPWAYSSERHTHNSPVHIASAGAEAGWIGEHNGGVVGSSEWIWLTDGDGEFIAAGPDIAARAIEAESSVRDLLRYVRVLEGATDDGDEAAAREGGAWDGSEFDSRSPSFKDREARIEERGDQWQAIMSTARTFLGEAAA